MATWIAISDPRGEYWEGSLVSSVEVVRALRNRGVVFLPIDREFIKLNALAGFSKRAWGSGWDFPASSPQRVGAMGMYVHHDLSALHWAARLMPTSEAFKTDGSLDRLNGSIRVSPDPTQHGALTADIDMSERGRVDVDRLGKMDEEGGWNVGGKVRIRMSMDGYIGLSLYGAARGLKLVWCAYSQTRDGIE